MRGNRRKIGSLLVIFCLTLGLALPLAGCGKTEPVTKESYYFDTVCDITIYDMEGMSEDRAEKAIRGAFRQCSYYEDTLSKTVKGSDIWKINHAAGKPVRVSDVTLAVLRDGIRFGDLTKGTFDITVGKAEDLYDFHAEKHAVPTDRQLEQAVKYIDYRQIRISGNRVSMGTAKGEVDLGGIAKGYIADRVARYLKQKWKVSSGIISLGGNIVCIGSKNGESFNVGIDRPFSDRSEIVGYTKVKDATLVTSGVYERYFRKNGKLYHHILDPKTGRPVNTDILGVTIVAPDGRSANCDALATTCLILGKQDALRFMKKHFPSYKVLIVDRKYKVTKSKNMAFQPAE